MTAGHRIAAAALLPAVLLLGACGSSASPGDPSAPVVVMTQVDRSDGMAAIVEGSVSVADDGCVHVGGMLAVWPTGTWWSAEQSGVVLPDGTVARRGSRVSGGGGYLHRGDLARLVSDRQLLSRCAATDEIAVFNPGSEVRAG